MDRVGFVRPTAKLLRSRYFYKALRYFDTCAYLLKYCVVACDERHQFSCKDGECLPSEQRCNHVRDCTDGSDEVDCSK